MAQSNQHTFQKLRDIFPPEKASRRCAQSSSGVVFDPSRCTGCGLCESVCAAGGEKQGTARTPRVHVMRGIPAGTNFAILCQHCLDPQCMKACPNGAISKAKDGIVRMDKTLCVNCGMCIAACPEAAPLRDSAGEVVKCDLCGGSPACVEACPSGALSYTKGSRKLWIPPLRWLCQAVSFFLLVIFLTGSVCSLNAITFDIACPFGVLQNVFSTKAILLTTITAAVLLMLLTYVFGRAFCGWMCPFGFILDLVDKVIPHGLFRLPRFLRSRLNKYGIGIGGLAAAGAVGTQAFCTVCPIGTVCRSYGMNSVMAGAETAIVPALA
ncbi:MAG: 4Fe-4S binding protein, partial [Mailhella sp.]|nr:4Fe-4S binding protein [Mailhella sp.]